MSYPKLIKTPNGGLPGPVVVAIMDGVGIGTGDVADAVAQAATPNLDRFSRSPISTQLCAHGIAVGMPTDQDMGNSEVGHNAIGAGRIFPQGAKLVDNAIRSGAIFEGQVWQQIIHRCKSNRTPIHLIGLLSDGNVHSHIDHLLALINKANSEGIEDLYIHALLDGRDVGKTSALQYVDQLEAALAPIDARPDRRYKIASGGGRMTITMDRYEADWEMVARGWKAHVLGEGRQFSSAQQAVETQRAEHPGICDQDLEGFVITDAQGPIAPIHDGAAVIAFNFRGDRTLELTYAFEDESFDKFERGRWPQVLFAGMMEYDGDTKRPNHYLVAPPQINKTVSELLCQEGITQLACSETQKFGHVTYFWNGNRSGYFDKSIEHYIEIPSYPAPFDAHPEMRASEIIDAVLKELVNDKFKFARLNLANGDMIGHTGDLQATIKAVEVVDQVMGRLVEAVTKMGGAVIVTADHGNADDMAEKHKTTGEILRDSAGIPVAKTSHSLNPVPFYVVTREAHYPGFGLAAPAVQSNLGNIASSALTLLGYETPDDFLPSLITHT